MLVERRDRLYALFYNNLRGSSVVILGRLVLIAIFILAVYLPLRGWKCWQGGWRYIALLPLLPLLGLLAYVFDIVFTNDPEQVLSPEIVFLVMLGSLLFSAVLGLFHNKANH